MKNVTIIIASFLLGCIALVSVMTITGRTDRQTELSENLPSAVEETMNTLLVKRQYQIADKEEFIADFRENIAKVIDSEGEITVDVAGMDMEKGVLSVRVTLDYLHPNGEPGSVSCERTVVFDQTEAENAGICVVRFYLTPDGECYKQYKLHPGECPAPLRSPQSAYGSFAGWFDADGNLIDFSQPVDRDMTYYARWS